ncbi:hypothetical protein [Pseudorhodoplanes sp.]|uniref:hypothetical protein n=1 Tax=Pseudorhodoplanes sp. TaxID=1934341 RepID=UPI00391CC0FA
MTKIILAFLLAFSSSAFAQTGCPVCEQAITLREALRKIDIADATQKAQGQTLGRQALALLAEFRDSLPPPKQGRRAFDALTALGGYAAPFTAGEYEKTLAAIGLDNPDYRKRYQALVRKGIRGKDKPQACRMRYLQTHVAAAECRLQEAAKGASDDLAAKRCDANYSLEDCLAKNLAKKR